MHQPFIGDLGATLRGNVIAQIHIEFARDLEVIGRPRVSIGVINADSAAAGDGQQRIHLRIVERLLLRL